MPADNDRTTTEDANGETPVDRTHEERVRDAGVAFGVVAVSATMARQTGKTEETATVWPCGRDGGKRRCICTYERDFNCKCKVGWRTDG